MPVNVVELPRDLRGIVDRFVLTDPTFEYGGFIFGTPRFFASFLPVPNVSAEPRSKYQMPSGADAYAKLFGAVVGYNVVAHVHTHPNHSIPSEQDHRYHTQHTPNVPYHVLIAPNVGERKTTWWVLDQHFEVQEIQETDKALENASLLLARRFGFVDLGHVLMDMDGTVRSEGRIAQALVTSPDARLLYCRLRTTTAKLNSVAAVSEAAGLSRDRTEAALEALEAAGLLLVQRTGARRAIYLVEVVDLFGRRVGAT